jgi:hypothetical protein
MPILLPSDPPLVDVPVTQVLWRVHPLEYDPLWFGPTGGRFDTAGGEFGTCYFGATLGVAILETLVRGKKVPIISHTELKARGGSSVGLIEPLRMLQLEGKGLPSFGIGAHRISGDGYGECQELARRVHKRLGVVDGIQYRSRWDTSELCWALFERARTKLGAILGTSCLGELALVRPALQPYRHVTIC